MIAASSGSLDVVGKAASVTSDFEGSFGAFCKVLRPNGKVDPVYFAHFFRTQEYRRRVSALAAGANINNLRNEHLDDLELALPPLAEQHRVAAVLDKADELRAKRRAALVELDALTQSIFLEMFGNPVTNPKGWTTVAFESLCHRVTVGIVVKPASYYAPKGVPALRSLNIKQGKIVFRDLVYFSESDNNTKLRKTKLKTGDLVLVRSGQPGTAAVVPPELDGVNAIDLLIATPRTNLAESTFLCYFFNSSGGRDLVLSKQRGQVQKHLNVGSLSEALIPLPGLHLQQEFARRVTAIEALKAKHHAALAELDALFASLQNQLFARY